MFCCSCAMSRACCCCCEAQNDSRFAQDCKAAVRIDTGAGQWLVWLCFVAAGLLQSDALTARVSPESSQVELSLRPFTQPTWCAPPQKLSGCPLGWSGVPLQQFFRWQFRRGAGHSPKTSCPPTIAFRTIPGAAHARGASAASTPCPSTLPSRPTCCGDRLCTCARAATDAN